MVVNDPVEWTDADEYPLTSEELIDRHGAEVLELQDGTERIADVLGRLGSETFESAEEARLAIYGAVSKAAVGRVGYSDRDPTPPGSPYGHEQLSF